MGSHAYGPTPEFSWSAAVTGQAPAKERGTAKVRRRRSRLGARRMQGVRRYAPRLLAEMDKASGKREVTSGEYAEEEPRKNMNNVCVVSLICYDILHYLRDEI